MVRLRPPSVPVRARWTRTSPSVSLIGLLLFILTCSHAPFVTSSLDGSRRNLTSKQTSINMDPVSHRTIFRSRTELAPNTLMVAGEVDQGIHSSVARRQGSSVELTLRVAREVDQGIHSSVARRQGSSVELRKLNRLTERRSKNNKQRYSEAPTSPSMNSEAPTSPSMNGEAPTSPSMNGEAPTSPSMNVGQFSSMNTETINRQERYSALKNLSTVQSRTDVLQSRTAVSQSRTAVSQSRTAVSQSRTAVSQSRTAVSQSRTAVSQSLGSDFGNGNVTAQSRLLNRHWVPRVMLDLYEAAQRPGHTSPYGANIVRSFTPLESVSVMNLTLLGDSFGEEDNRGYEGRGDATLSPSITPDTVSYSFPFQLVLPKGEHIRNLLLRLHTIVGRKHSPAGLERRLRVLVTHHPTSASSAGEYSTTRLPRPVEVARKDVYLHNHAWLTLNVRPLLRHLRPPEHVLNVTLEVQIERAFASVGDTGDLALDHTSGIDFQPLLLLYTSQPNLTRKEKHQFFHFASRPRRSVHENDWDWDGGEEGEEEEPEPPGRDPGRKGRRAGRRRRAKNTCKRRPLKVDFESIGWQDWVIAPLEYEAYQCSGKCFYPLASHLNPTKHAVIQTLMHSRSSERARRACCVPTLLGPISLLYLEDGVPTFKKEYDDMVALECGCR